MMSRSAYKMQHISFIAIPGVVAVSLFFGLDWFDTVSNDASPQDQPVAENLEAYAEGINTILFDADGLVDYTLQADRQLHYKDQVTVLEAPFIRMFREGESRWNIVADSGRISPAPDSGSTIENIELTGNVEIYLMDEAGSRTVLSMDRLSIDPNQETLNTENQVMMTSENLKQTADGMFASLTEEIVTFKRNVSGRYSPPGKSLEELESNVSN